MLRRLMQEMISHQMKPEDLDLLGELAVGPAKAEVKLAGWIFDAQHRSRGLAGDGVGPVQNTRLSARTDAGSL